MDDWCPIATAPLTGERVLLTCKWQGTHTVVVASWDKDKERWRCFDGGMFKANEWTHWMPLPVPPKD